MDPNGLLSTDDNTEPATHHQTGSSASLGNKPSKFINDHIHTYNSSNTDSNNDHDNDDDDDDDDDDNLPPLIHRPHPLMMTPSTAHHNLWTFNLDPSILTHFELIWLTTKAFTLPF